MIYYQDIFRYMLNRHLPLLPIYMYCLIIGKINKPPCYNVIINDRTISYPIVNLLHYIIYGTSSIGIYIPFIDGLPFLKMVDLSMATKNNQIVHLCCSYIV